MFRNELLELAGGSTFDKEMRARPGRRVTAVCARRRARVLRIRRRLMCGLSPALVVAVVAGTGVLGAEPAAATPDEAKPPVVLLSEGFENNVPDTGQRTLITQYQGIGNVTYDADDYYKDAKSCNGIIASQGNTKVGNASTGDCSNSAPADVPFQSIRMAANAVGIWAGTGASNNSVLGFHTNNSKVTGVGEGSLYLKSTPLTMAATTRFLMGSVILSGANCTASQPFASVRMAVADKSYTTNMTANPWIPCGDGTVNQEGAFPGGKAWYHIDRYTTPAVRYLASDFNVRLAMIDPEGAPNGNGRDWDMDDLVLTDVTPTLDVSAAPVTRKANEITRVTYTVTNTTELAEKTGWSFSVALPAGLAIAAVPDVTNTCGAGTTALPGSATFAAADGTLGSGVLSCTIAFDVVSSEPVDAPTVTYTLAPEAVTLSYLNPPKWAAVTYRPDMRLALVKTVSSLQDVDGDGITDQGDKITYDFAVTNAGTSKAIGLTITDVPLDAAASCPITEVAGGATVHCSGVHTVTGVEARAGLVTNTATVTGSDPDDQTVTSAPSTVTQAVTEHGFRPGVSITKRAYLSSDTAFSSPLAARLLLSSSTSVVWRYVITNNGDAPLSNVEVVDSATFTRNGFAPAPVPVVVTCPQTTLAAGQSMICSGAGSLVPVP